MSIDLYNRQLLNPGPRPRFSEVIFKAPNLSISVRGFLPIEKTFNELKIPILPQFSLYLRMRMIMKNKNK